MTDPLPRPQQLFLQRLMAAHSMTDEEALQVLNDLDEERELEQRDVTACLRSINKQLVKGFGLEIVTMIAKGGKVQHAVINQHADDVAKASFSAVVDPSQRFFIRLVLEALAEGPSVRSNLINLRTDLQEPLKLDLDKADKCIQQLLEEHWLTLSTDSTQRRESMNAKILLGPRAFLELSRLMTDLGYPKDDLPQFVFHR
jgi:Nse1 non-SMC component of SMC5-6 complex